MMPHPRRFLLLLPMVALAWLTACAPAATPSAAQPVLTAMPAATAAPGMAESGQGVVLPVSPAANRMVIKNAEIDLLVEDVDGALARVTQLTADLGGYVISSQTTERGGQRYASLQMAVPAVQFEATLNQLRALGVKVLHESASGQDVSAEYVDLQSRLTNLEATAARVREFLNEAQTVEESLRVNQQLSELEGQIEQVKGQMKYYEGRAAFSTIALSLTPKAGPVADEDPVWNPGRTVADATEVLVGLLQAVADLAIWLGVVFGPFALVGLLALGIGLRWLRGQRKARA